MKTRQQPEKICAVCGMSCAGQPRTKDVKGRYFHKECHQQALKEIRDRKSTRASDETPLLTPQTDDPFAVADEGVIDPPPVVQIRQQTCPDCGNTMSAESVVCVNCGFNFQTGERMLVQELKPSRVTGSGALWPALVGIISIVFGSSGVLLCVLDLCTSLAQPAAVRPFGPGFVPVKLVAVGIPALMSLWLLLAGIGILRRKQTSMVSIRRWAVVKIVLVCLFLTCLTGALLLLVGEVSGKPDHYVSEAIGGVGLGIVVTIELVLAAWFLAWPIFVLKWFSRAVVQRQVGTWD